MKSSEFGSSPHKEHSIVHFSSGKHAVIYFSPDACLIVNFYWEKTVYYTFMRKNSPFYSSQNNVEEREQQLYNT